MRYWMKVPALPVGDPQELGFSIKALQRIDSVIGHCIARRRFPGAVSLIARRGQIAWFNAQGRLEPQGATVMPADAIFRIYSMTKPVVSVTIMMLAEEGHLLLTDPLQKYIPEFGQQKVVVEGEAGIEYHDAQRAITIQDLLRHTSGLAYDFVATGPIQKLYLESGLHRRSRTNEEFCQVLAELPLYRQPGESWDYSFSTDVLGRVIEIVCGKPLRDVLLEKILLPLGMFETDFFVPPEKHARIAEPFPADPETGEAANLF